MIYYIYNGPPYKSWWFPFLLYVSSKPKNKAMKHYFTKSRLLCKIFWARIFNVFHSVMRSGNHLTARLGWLLLAISILLLNLFNLAHIVVMLSSKRRKRRAQSFLWGVDKNHWRRYKHTETSERRWYVFCHKKKVRIRPLVESYFKLELFNEICPLDRISLISPVHVCFFIALSALSYSFSPMSSNSSSSSGFVFGSFGGISVDVL